MALNTSCSRVLRLLCWGRNCSSCSKLASVGEPDENDDLRMSGSLHSYFFFFLYSCDLVDRWKSWVKPLAGSEKCLPESCTELAAMGRSREDEAALGKWREAGRRAASAFCPSILFSTGSACDGGSQTCSGDRKHVWGNISTSFLQKP